MLCIKISANLFANHSSDSETNLLLLWGVSLCFCFLQESEDSVSNRDTGHGGHPVPEGGALFHHVGTMATTAGRITHVAQALLRRSPPGGLSPGPAPDSRASGLATLRPKLDGAWREGARATPPRRRHLPPVSGPRRPENSFGDGTADATRRASLSRLWSEVAAAPPRVAHAGRGRAGGSAYLRLQISCLLCGVLGHFNC